MSLFAELKRRNVFRVAVLYVIASWLILQVAEVLTSLLPVPEWTGSLVFLLLVVGFIPALIFSWVYELTPEGLKRDRDVDRGQSITAETGRKLDIITIVLVGLAIAVVVADRLVPEQSRFAQIEEAAEKPQVDDASVTVPPAKSIAVLPFANRSANPDDAFFVDGIHDDLLTHISRIGSIKTISRTSVMRYRGSSKSIPEIASELGVSTVLEGGVQRAGDQVRINVQLIDASTDDHLWSEIYDRQLTAENIFTIQSEIAEAIAGALQTTLSPAEQRRIRSVPTDNLEAYEAYLLGRQRMAQRSTDSVAESAEYFREAVELDPKFALAWVGLADTYQLQVRYSGLPETETYAKAEAALAIALELDQDLGEAYASLGMLRRSQHEFDAAEQHFKRSLELNPNYPSAHLWYSHLLTEHARIDEALASLETAVELDPRSPIIRINYALDLRAAGRVEEALDQLETALDIDPDFVSAHEQMATIQWQVFNRCDEAIQGYVNAIAADPHRSESYIWPGQLYLDLGVPGRASKLIDRAVELDADGFASLWGRQLLQLYRGEIGTTYDKVASLIADWGAVHWVSQFSAAQFRNQALARGQPFEALAIYSDAYPQLLSEQEPDIGLGDYRAAIDLALVLKETGDSGRSALLLERAVAFIRTRPRLGWWAGYWISDVQILAMQGKKEEALDALQQAADEGWRSLWWYYLRYDPSLDSIRGEPAFQAVEAQIEADMAAQMERIRDLERSGEIAPVPGVVFDPRPSRSDLGP